MGVTGNRVFTVIFPWMSWFMKYRIEYITIPLWDILTIAIVDSLFKDVLHKKMLYTIYGVSAVLGLLFIFLDTVFMSRMLNCMLYGYLAAAIWLSVCFARFIWERRRAKVVFNPEQKVLTLGLAMFIVAVLADSGVLVRLFHMPPFHMAGVAVLVFALFEAAAIFTATMREIEEAKKNELEAIVKGQILATENTALDSLNRMKAQYLANMSHNIKTPLTAISADIQRAARLVGRGELLDERVTRSLLRAQDEVMHTARLTESALHMAAMQESWEKMNILDTASLFIHNAEAYRSHVEKQGNVLKIDAPNIRQCR